MPSSVSPYGRDLLVLTKKGEGDKFATDLSVKRTGDLETVEGRDLMIQAIRHRLLTRKGEIASLGHPEYGSLLEEVIGEPNIPDTHRIIETLIRDCLKYETRIKNIISVKASPSDKEKDVVHIFVHVELSGEGDELKITYPLYLEE